MYSQQLFFDICLICFNPDSKPNLMQLALFIEITFDIVSICENFQLLGNAINSTLTSLYIWIFALKWPIVE